MSSVNIVRVTGGTYWAGKPFMLLCCNLNLLHALNQSATLVETINDSSQYKDWAVLVSTTDRA
jgi:hypothetical protein